MATSDSIDRTVGRRDAQFGSTVIRDAIRGTTALGARLA
jgi:hypothetical protein